MRTLDKYILSNFVVTFVLAILVLTFVMTIGLFFGLMKYIARGADAMAILQILFESMPGTLSYSVPIAALVSSLLVFSRLSSDSEISAMRSCGVPLRRIMRGPVLLAVLLSLCCLHINNNIAPESAEKRKAWKNNFKVKDITSLIEPGVWVTIEDYSIYVQSRDGDLLKDLRVNQPLKNGTLRELRAATAVITTNEDEVPVMDLTDVTISPFDENRPGTVRAATWQLPLSALSKDAATQQQNTKKKTEKDSKKRVKDRYSWEILRDIIVAQQYPPHPLDLDARKDLSRSKAEIAERITLAVACLCFVLVGIPMGIQSHRRESSIGLGISLAVAGAFYLFCLTGESLSKNPDIPAHWIILIPIPVCLLLSTYVTRKKD